jgi:hypothetical protein
MKNTRAFPGAPDPSLNGHGGAANGGATQAKAGAERDGIDREATRYLSAATHVDVSYAETVVSRVMNESFRALAPTFGVDVPVVVKWALQALRTRAFRDYILAVTFLLVVLSLVPPLWPLGLILFPAALVIAWLVVSWETWERFHHVVGHKMLRDRFDPAAAPEPTNPADCERLTEVAKRRDGNLVVFSGHSAFIGSGDKLYYQRILLDVSRGREAEDGTPMEPDPFTSQDLHAAIVKAFGYDTGLAKSLENIRVYERLFVNGLHIQNAPRLLPDPFQPPPSLVDRDLLVAAALHPTAEARTYVCVEMPGWQGQLVVTMFIRAVHTGASLYIDWTFRVLRPLRSEFLWIDKFHQLPRYRQLQISLKWSLRDTAPALFQSPFKVYRAWRLPHKAQRYKNRQTRAIRNGYIFDYGALKSIREQACGTQRRHYFLARDEHMYVLLAQQTLTRAVEIFLKEHNVDLDQYTAQVQVIFDNSIKVGDISNSSGVNVGNNSSATVNRPRKERNDGPSGQGARRTDHDR